MTHIDESKGLTTESGRSPTSTGDIVTLRCLLAALKPSARPGSPPRNSPPPTQQPCGACFNVLRPALPGAVVAPFAPCPGSRLPPAPPPPARAHISHAHAASSPPHCRRRSRHPPPEQPRPRQTNPRAELPTTWRRQPRRGEPGRDKPGQERPTADNPSQGLADREQHGRTTGPTCRAAGSPGLGTAESGTPCHERRAKAAQSKADRTGSQGGRPGGRPRQATGRGGPGKAAGSARPRQAARAGDWAERPSRSGPSRAAQPERPK
jgi:hypothetical protein